MILSDSRDEGPISRIPAPVKLLALFGLSIVLFMQSRLPVLAGLTAGVFMLAILFCRHGLTSWLKAWPLLLTIAAVVAWTAYAEGVNAFLIVLMRLASLSLFATIVTVTTTVGQFIDTTTRCARPLERLGIGNAADIGLAIGLVIRFVPDVYGRYQGVKQAHQARGLRLRFSTIIVPLIIGTLTNADEIANAIDARNIRTRRTEPDQGA